MELRVHGIGGPSAESVLGCPPDAPSVPSWRSEPGARSEIRRMAGRLDRRCLHWSALTSGSRLFAIWPLLLPFTLANLAGWMGPPGRAARSAIYRGAAVLFGLTMTSGLVVWATVGGIGVWWWAGSLPAWVPGEWATQRFWLGWASAGIVVGAVVAGATYTASGFERYRRQSRRDLPRVRWRWPWGATLRTHLDDARFFDNGDDHRVRWRIHALVALATWFGIVALVLGTDGTTAADLPIARLLLAIGVVQGAALGAMALVALARDSSGRDVAWRVSGPAVAVVAQALLGGMVLSGLLALDGVSTLAASPLAMLYDVYGWGVAAAIVAAAGVVVLRLQVPSAPERAGTAVTLVPGVRARLQARLAPAVGNAGAVVGPAAATFAIGAVIAVAARWVFAPDDGTRWRLTETPPVTLARVTFFALLGFLVVNLVKSRASPRALRSVGRIWDVITFWPRAYHPFAVRPYSERVVPELQDFLAAHRGSEPIVINAHSQGGVLALAALRPGALGDAPVRLVTFGCPLRSLYSRAFPAYVGAAEIEATQEMLQGAWVNLFRFTDHVGRAVFVDDLVAAHPRRRGPDQPLTDPAFAGGPVQGHSHSFDDPRVEAVVADLAASTVEGLR